MPSTYGKLWEVFTPKVLATTVNLKRTLNSLHILGSSRADKQYKETFQFLIVRML